MVEREGGAAHGEAETEGQKNTIPFLTMEQSFSQALETVEVLLLLGGVLADESGRLFCPEVAAGCMTGIVAVEKNLIPQGIVSPGLRG